MAVLALFDIDGTLLIRAAAAHREALLAAIADVFGPPAGDATRIEAAGRTDLDIAREILTLRGISAERIDASAEALREAACREYAHRCPADLSEHLAPGVMGVLEELASRRGVILSLVTGNLEPIARLKLARAGIGRFFAAGQGGFGSDSEERAALPGIARARAGADAGPYPRQSTVVIGDTPRDIACARADGVRCVAVSSGPFGPQELSDADAVAGDARELLAALDALDLDAPPTGRAG